MPDEFAGTSPTTARWRFQSNDAAQMQRVRVEVLAYLRAYARSGDDFHACKLAFGELVANAIHHAPPGELAVTIDWTSETPVLSVNDSGDGFELVMTLPERHRTSGRGLYIVNELAGPVRVETKRGGGCTVSVQLPLRRASA